MGYRILVVDDSKLARMAIAKALNTLHPDWTRIEATNAPEALALAKGGDIDLVLLDVNMPGGDGLNLAGALRDLNPAMPVAVISANHQKEIVARSHEMGAAFLAKPVTREALGEFLDGAVDRLKAAGR
jgi:CheY-like chemotaxis protein